MTNHTTESRATEYMQRFKGVVRKLKHYRCGQCNARRSLKREIWQYIRPPKCRTCGAADWRFDMQRYKEFKTRTGVFDTCYCNNVSYPHRKASTVWCIEHPTGPTEADYTERHGEQQ